jgi:uncharacterized glyoxalase superfamily protein PhnB
MLEELLNVNLILYCASWESTVRFYRDGLGLQVTMENDWFVEFRLGPRSTVSVADESRASIKSSDGGGVTIAMQVADVREAWEAARARGLEPTEIMDHPWGAKLFHVFDPEGHRLEMWQTVASDPGTGG